MPLKVVVELQIHAVSCPGVYLAEKKDVYLHVCILGQCKETGCLPPIFPLLFGEKMWFEKVFEKATDPVAVVELLKKNVTKFQLTELIPPEGEEIAFYEDNTRDFLFPEPKLTPTYPGVDREILMNTHPSFPGIAPKLEFSTRTTITELPLLPRRWYQDRNKSRLQRSASTSPQRRSISPARWRTARNKTCKRLTRSLQSRSPSLSPTRCLHQLHRESHPLGLKFKAEIDHRRPPFVVRHVDSSKSFSDQTPLKIPCRNARQNASPSRSHHKYQLKRALSFDSWKAACPAAKVIREPDERYSLDLASSPLETKGPVSYSSNTLPISHNASFAPSKCYRSASHGGRWASPQHRIYSSPSATWEEINERVRNLLTSEEAKHRLTFGATDSEIDDVLERRSVSSRSSPHCDLVEKRYYL